LIYLLSREKGYPSEIAGFYSVSLSMMQKQLMKFELAGILVSQRVGKSLIYSFNPRYAFLAELKALLNKAFEFYSPEEKERLEFNRRRPRISCKQL